MVHCLAVNTLGVGSISSQSTKLGVEFTIQHTTPQIQTESGERSVLTLDSLRPSLYMWETA